MSNHPIRQLIEYKLKMKGITFNNSWNKVNKSQSFIETALYTHNLLNEIVEKEITKSELEPNQMLHREYYQFGLCYFLFYDLV